jgi:hypothetical protein
MSLNEVLVELRQLDRKDKMRAMQFLMQELAEDIPIKLNSEYEIWSPYGAFGAAKALQDLLKADNTETHE